MGSQISSVIWGGVSPRLLTGMGQAMDWADSTARGQCARGRAGSHFTKFPPTAPFAPAFGRTTCNLGTKGSLVSWLERISGGGAQWDPATRKDRGSFCQVYTRLFLESFPPVRL